MTKAAPFSFVLYVLKTGSLVLCGLVLPLAPLTLTGADGLAYECRFFFLCVYVLMVGFLMLCGLVLPLAPLTLRGALMDYRSI